ncbi:serine hydroxymethyltransferase [Loktanella salsilacus]|jgi:glycine hydroxymethyltransferase|uniref:Serine hydroxymethyltransferase n=1 Tax=Loktanella salsilacus TaxID=195913 RepID=A0A1I4FRT0_9RHOB|nr:serine hydroxymethyltransferase [Loktanella salsilacus]MBU0779413.1 serine hydroxymethyltransferase [Alphaproteobacteria bacterium]MBU0861776.1 serine hydroxymethyltransferase [Alphaproteobacteria bacterium]MBU1835505.1 serine hydroxymethyltransferase [Alphaproteobacteria bacterium]UTH47313.1 serine hydroxymethyltransferase [Loktanella salsilacus]SFL19371.1 glycine hydroxymethyltransferase [Loktanella salsilacus]|tara:strand:+ start:969 stop:2264 length:1296 start_codon:yes stop_codon:yes gene_type:complete
MNAPTRDDGFFTESLASRDPEIAKAMDAELGRQRKEIELIASENIVSAAVMEAQGGVMTNKYAEGYPGRRYYGGCEHVDVAENLAIDRAKQLFSCDFANVQPNSGSQANQGVFQALLQPGDTILGMSLDAGGHLTHGAKPNQSGKWFNAIQYGVRAQDLELDYDQVAELAAEHQPKMIIAGGSAIPRIIDFEKMRAIADSVGAYLLVDMAHFAGLVAAGLYPSPFPHAHVATTTTHKTLRGPRGGMILTNDENIAKKVNSAIFPGIQGGPLMHVIAAKAVAFGEALRPGFKDYQKQVVLNAQALADELMKCGLDIVTGGTDTHLMLVDLRPKGVKGNATESALGRAHITCNKNGIPFDSEKPTITSGVRLGSPAGTTRGFTEEEFRQIGRWIGQVVDGLAANGEEGNAEVEAQVRAEVEAMCDRFPIYPNL